MNTIERTSKPIKLLRATGFLAVLGGGLAFVIQDVTVGLLFVLLGAAVLGVARFLAWWFHG